MLMCSLNSSIDKLCLKRQEREDFTQTPTPTIVVLAGLNTKVGSQCTPIGVNEYQPPLLCSARRNHHQMQVAVFAKQIMDHQTVQCLMGSQWMKDGN